MFFCPEFTICSYAWWISSHAYFCFSRIYIIIAIVIAILRSIIVCICTCIYTILCNFVSYCFFSNFLVIFALFNAVPLALAFLVKILIGRFRTWRNTAKILRSITICQCFIVLWATVGAYLSTHNSCVTIIYTFLALNEFITVANVNACFKTINHTIKVTDLALVFLEYVIVYYTI